MCKMTAPLFYIAASFTIHYGLVLMLLVSVMFSAYVHYKQKDALIDNGTSVPNSNSVGTPGAPLANMD